MKPSTASIASITLASLASLPSVKAASLFLTNEPKALWFDVPRECNVQIVSDPSAGSSVKCRGSDSCSVSPGTLSFRVTDRGSEIPILLDFENNGGKKTLYSVSLPFRRVWGAETDTLATVPDLCEERRKRRFQVLVPCGSR